MSSLRRDALAGALAGLLAGLALGWAMQAQVMMAQFSGLVGLPALGAGLVLHLGVSGLVGAAFGALFRFQPRGHAAAISHGLMLGLVWWIIVPLTLTPLAMGRGPTWSLAEAANSYSLLLGYLSFGGLLGFLSHLFVAGYLRRFPAPEIETGATTTLATRIVILGGGYGGLSAAQRFEHILRRFPGVEVTLVSQSNYLLHTPMLSEVASGELEAQHISAPLRAAIPDTQVIHATAEVIDATARTVNVRAHAGAPSQTIVYDHLVLAVGSVANYYGLPGLQAHSLSLKTLADASRLRNHVITQLERADVEADEAERRAMLTFVVAGAGFAGTEMLAALHDMVHSILRYYPNIDPNEPRFVMIHSRDRILPELSEKLAGYARAKMAARGIEFMLEVRVAGATPSAVLFKGREPLPTRTLIWTAGSQPTPILQTLLCEHDARGAVLTDGAMRVQGLTNVWAIGDAAAIPTPFDGGGFYPPTAQHALREGKAVADNIADVLAGKPPKPFRFQAIGLLASLGTRTAVAEIRGRRFSGLLAWIMWRSIYWSKLPGAEKKLRVALDWTIDLFFPRDIVLTDDASNLRPTHVDTDRQR